MKANIYDVGAMAQLKAQQTRTIPQNASLHLWFSELAEMLNQAGLDMRVVLKPEIAIPWSAKSVKEMLWRPVQKVQLGKESTTALTTQEIDKVYEVLARHLGEKFGVQPSEFPSIERNIYDSN